MSQHRPVSRIGRAYIFAVILVGAAIIGHSLWRMHRNPPGVEWFILAALTLLTGSFTVKVPSLAARISVSETFVFTSVLLFGPAAGTATVVLDALIASFWLKRANRSLTKVLFNAAAPATAIWCSSVTFFAISGATPGLIHDQNLNELIGPIFAFALLYFSINSCLVTGALATQQDASPLRIWARNFPSVSITYFVGSSIALLIVAYTPEINLTVLSIILPLLVISYLTFRTSMGRLEDATRHVAQLNELYLSTIETLAMAVDAKDQITHGHIRRVQVYATELAKRLGVRDERQLKAIEAAALLHDMGKLAIPEHILNKPGKLTSAEFDKMKKHADIGADLLSSIRFPYPVVPIVRHHHENWDGKGYPNGVSGTDIPLGARILSVVDCFDALTSDRPYRPRLTSEDAFRILSERKGTMYDPLVVDAFVGAYAEIAPAANAAGQHARSLVPSHEWTDVIESVPSVSLNAIRANAAEASLLNEADRSLAQSRTLREAVDTIGQFVRQLSPATVCALFHHVAESDSYTCTHAAGDTDGLLGGLTIRRGERITGWVGANGGTISNSDATLDLANIAQLFRPTLQSAISTPVLSGGSVVAVLTAYSPKSEPFSDSHRYAIEHLAASLGDRIAGLRDTANGVTVVPFKEVKKRSPTR